MRTKSSCRMREEHVRWPVKGRGGDKRLEGVWREHSDREATQEEQRGFWRVRKRMMEKTVDKIGKDKERGRLNLGVRGHWSVWQPEIQICNLEQGRGERRARRWGPNGFCVCPPFMKMDGECAALFHQYSSYLPRDDKLGREGTDTWSPTQTHIQMEKTTSQFTPSQPQLACELKLLKYAKSGHKAEMRWLNSEGTLWFHI